MQHKVRKIQHEAGFSEGENLLSRHKKSGERYWRESYEPPMKTLEEDMHRTAWSSDDPEPADRLAMPPSFWRNAISRNPLPDRCGFQIDCGEGAEKFVEVSGV